MILPNELIDIFCTIQRGMLGNVTPNLRALFVVINNITIIELIYYYDKTLSEVEEDCTGVIDADVVSDFPPPVYHVDYTIKIIPYPNKITQDGYYLYKRFEK